MAYTTVNKSTDHFNTKLYTGNGSSLAVTGVGFQPDWLWIKQRNTTRSHQLMDAVRGASYRLHSDQAAAQSSSALTSFDSDGFTVDGTSLNGTNQSSGTYTSWNWKANGAGSSNTDGTITSTVSANTTSGFSIVKYTGDGSNTATIGHGLGTIPSMVIMKPLSYTGAWWITHKNLPTDNVLEFNTNTTVSYSSFGGGGLRQSQYTSSVITGGAGGGNVSNLWNDSGENYIAYCFTEKVGYSRFGSFTGNGDTDGSFVYCGFKPAWIMFKPTSSVSNDWYIYDTKRYTINVNNRRLVANGNASESTTATDKIDIVSNGFKMRHGSASFNTSGENYIFMAFAEAPLVGSNNIPCTAR